MPKIRGIDYQQLEDALNKVGINTDTKEAALTIVAPADSEAVGFIAQEMADILPKQVCPSDDGEGTEVPEETQPWTMTESGMVPYLVAAIKELKTKNDELEARLAALEE